MSAFTIEKANNLYWLGRYIERVFISITAYQDIFDRIIDGDEHAYHDYCKQLDIDDFYLNDAHFVTSYLYDRDNPDSLISNLLRAYDNAIVLREEITSATLSYIQLACNAFEKMEFSEAPVLQLQQIKDDIFAFWGCVDETVDEVEKNIIKCGKYVEQVDLCFRLAYDRQDLEKSISRLNNRILQLQKILELDDLNELLVDGTMNYLDFINKLNNLNLVFTVKDY